jgi:hypothetical protein
MFTVGEKIFFTKRKELLNSVILTQNYQFLIDYENNCRLHIYIPYQNKLPGAHTAVTYSPIFKENSFLTV